MKRYTLIATTIALFFGTQIVAMDRRKPSAEQIRSFKEFLGSKFQAIDDYFFWQTDIGEGATLLPGPNTEARFPVLDYEAIIAWRQFVRDGVKNYHLDKDSAYQAFLDVAKEYIIYRLLSEFPLYNAQAIEAIYNQKYFGGILYSAVSIFPS